MKSFKDKKIHMVLFYEVMGQTLYPKGHPYSWPIIGYIEDLDRATMQDLKDFCMRWYGPNNAYLVVTGDVEVDEVLSLANKYFWTNSKGEDVRELKYQELCSSTQVQSI